MKNIHCRTVSGRNHVLLHLSGSAVCTQKQYAGGEAEQHAKGGGGRGKGKLDLHFLLFPLLVGLIFSPKIDTERSSDTQRSHDMARLTEQKPRNAD
jgi:hypothetical protein